MKKEHRSPRVAPEVQQALRELISEGVIVEVEEIDPTTGTLRTRYYHRIHAPKGN